MPRRPVQQVTHQPLDPAKLSSLVRASDYFAKYPRLFSKPTSWRVFVDTRRAVLEEEGLIVTLTSGLHVDAEALDKRLGALLSTADGRPVAADQLALPLGQSPPATREKLRAGPRPSTTSPAPPPGGAS